MCDVTFSCVQKLKNGKLFGLKTNVLNAEMAINEPEMTGHTHDLTCSEHEICNSYGVLVENVNTKLKILRHDLMSMRKQDVKLLKQLVNISDVIQALRQKWQDSVSFDESFDAEFLQGSRNTSELIRTRKRAPLVRQQSVPRYYSEGGFYGTCAQGSYSSSIDDLQEVPEYDENEDGDISNANMNLSLSTGSYKAPPRLSVLRQRASSFDVPTSSEAADDTFFENLLMRNIQIWKKSGTPTSGHAKGSRDYCIERGSSYKRDLFRKHHRKESYC